MMTTLATFHDYGKKHMEIQAFRITVSNGLIIGKLKRSRSDDNPSKPGADLGFNERAADSNSQSEIAGGAS